MIISGRSVSIRQCRSGTLLTTDWKLTSNIFSFCGTWFGLLGGSFDLFGVEVIGQSVGSSDSKLFEVYVGLKVIHQTVQS